MRLLFKINAKFFKHKRYSTFLIIIIGCVMSSFCNAQNTEITKKPRIAGVKFGLTASNFYRRDEEMFLMPFKKPNLGFHAGLVIDLINNKRFASQIELSYVLKGSNEVFEDQNQITDVKTDLNYCQIDLIPILVKPFGYRPFNPYFSLGTYYSYLLSSNITYDISRKLNGIIVTDEKKVLNFDNFSKNDFGLFINTGIKLKSVSIEYRHEFGLKNIIAYQQLKNQINNVTIKFTY